MNNKLFVRSVSRHIDDATLRFIFSIAGSVELAEVVFDPFDGHSRGFGFVAMATETEAKKAIALLNGTIHAGAMLSVLPARQHAQQRYI
jgi:RNA recognition motif-containing protein